MQQTEEQRRLQEIAQKFAEEYKRDPEKMVAEYQDRFGNHLSPDNAVFLCDEYKAGSQEFRLKLSDEIRPTANEIKNAVWEKALKDEPSQDKTNMAVFLFSGAGSGKTTVKDEVLKEFLSSAHIVNESVFAFDERKIKESLAAGKEVGIIYVNRPVEKAVEGVIERSQHTPSLDYIAEGHFYTQRTFLDLAKQNESNPQVHVGILDNRGDKKDFRLITDSEKAVEIVKQDAYYSIEDAQFRAYRSYENVRDQRERQGNPISRETYSALFPDGERRFQDLQKDRRTFSREHEEGSNQGRGRSKEAASGELVGYSTRAEPHTDPKHQWQVTVTSELSNGEKVEKTLGVSGCPTAKEAIAKVNEHRAKLLAAEKGQKFVVERTPTDAREQIEAKKTHTKPQQPEHKPLVTPKY